APSFRLFTSNAWRGAPSKPERRQSSLAKSGNTGGRVRRTLSGKAKPSVQPPAKRIAGVPIGERGGEGKRRTPPALTPPRSPAQTRRNWTARSRVVTLARKGSKHVHHRFYFPGAGEPGRWHGQGSCRRLSRGARRLPGS